MRKIIIIALILIVSSCKIITGLTKQERQDNRVAKKIEKLQLRYPESFKNFTEVVSIDTLLPGFEYKASSELYIQPRINDLFADDTLYQKSLETLISSKNSLIHDVYSKPIKIDTLGVKVIAKVDSGVLNLYVKKNTDTLAIEKEVQKLSTKTHVIKDKKNELIFILIIVILLILYLYRK